MRDAYQYPDRKLIEREKLQRWFDTLNYPLHFFDFETWNPRIPPFDKTCPYTRLR